jgi:predicted Rossmann-fold nucleotide-binding protein
MEAANRGARDAAVRSIGRTFFVRELSFMLYASAFVVFPGGFGNPR